MVMVSFMGRRREHLGFSGAGSVFLRKDLHDTDKANKNSDVWNLQLPWFVVTSCSLNL